MNSKSYLSKGINISRELINDITFLCETRIKSTWEKIKCILQAL